MSETLCSLCHLAIQAGEPLQRCPSCQAPSHAECWEENGGCGTYGCDRAPETEKQTSPESPTYWGQESKICPACGKEIKAAALKCRHCHAHFENAVPVSKAEFQRHLNLKQTRQSSATWTWVLFIAGIIPCFSPLVLLIGGIIYFKNRVQIRSLNPLQKILARLGIAIAALWIVLALIIWIWTGRTRG